MLAICLEAQNTEHNMTSWTSHLTS